MISAAGEPARRSTYTANSEIPEWIRLLDFLRVFAAFHLGTLEKVVSRFRKEMLDTADGLGL